MAISSLQRMTVPLASDQSAPAQGLLMPKLRYRFRVEFVNFGIAASPEPTTELTKQVISFTRPNLSFEEIPLPVYNSTVKLAGKHSWADVTCEIRDDASGNVSRLVGAQLQKQLDFFEMASAAAGIDYKFVTNVQILDGGNGGIAPVVLEEFALYGCYLKGADFGALNYGTSEAATINMTIAYDNAALQSGEGRVPDGGRANAIGGVLGRVLGDELAATG